jgi:hypothetical protein
MDDSYVDFDSEERKDDIKTLLAELRSLAFSNIKGLYDENNCLKDIKDIPDSLMRCVQEITVDEIWSGTGFAREKIGETRRVKLWDKKGSVDSFMKHLGMFIERLEIRKEVTYKVQKFDLDERKREIKNRIQAVN